MTEEFIYDVVSSFQDLSQVSHESLRNHFRLVSSHPQVQSFYQMLSGTNLLQVDPEVYMTIFGLLIAMPVLSFNLFIIFKPLLNVQTLQAQAGIITVVKYVHYLLVMYLELTEPTSYFLWKSKKNQNIIEDIQEMGIVRFYQDQFRTKINMGLDLYDWLTSQQRLKAGKGEVSQSTAFWISVGLVGTLFYLGIPSDIVMALQMQYVDIESLNVIGQGRQGENNYFNLVWKILLSTIPIIYSLTNWLGSEVFPALIVGNQRENHPIGTTMSLILSFLYVVEPSILMASSYYI